MNLKDYIGKSYNRLTIIDIDYKRMEERKQNKKGKINYVICKCTCGNVKSINISNVITNKTKSCGCLVKEVARNNRFVDLTGKKINMLTILEIDKDETLKRKNYKTYWVCKCDCGNITTAEGSLIKSNHIKSCGCLQKKIARESNFKDLTGQKFGRLNVIRFIKTEKKNTYWECNCDCGTKNLKILSGNLIRGNTKSCGCLHLDAGEKQRRDLVGNVYGRLTVKEFYKSKNGKTYWKCLCECGKIHITSNSNLISGTTRSCGCYAKEIKSGEQNHLWRGGVTPIHKFLREKLVKWKKDSLEYYDYKCCITNNKKDLVIHHIYPFQYIIKEVFNYLGYEIKQKVSDYSDLEIDKLIEKTIELHYFYGLGAVISRDIHREFHKIYGNGLYGKKAPSKSEWEEFKNNFKIKNIVY